MSYYYIIDVLYLKRESYFYLIFAFLAISSIIKHINKIMILFILRSDFIYILIYIIYYFI